MHQPETGTDQTQPGYRHRPDIDPKQIELLVETPHLLVTESSFSAAVELLT
ncbi:hypothetical protein [Thermoleptolyngbya sp. C42_A2020_037]|uniref:hypothetical protein n=1 Tax=Thermoleptolyngbya sp. C42_A2020_037 TaxID=2747799 RepID=UPI0019F93F70|nr:hypothetical protein [Thermoleptolyngbya sp. C42_A2020_037]MBF2086981.1 hypothetical protein [Thermoleptolyngbya sp. C42_A2020_037]